MNAIDRRKFPRLEGKFPVDLLNMGDDRTVNPYEVIIAGQALDVSRQGIRLLVSYNVSIGTILSVIVYFSGRESVCMCEVVWKREAMGQKLYGLYIKQWSKMDSKLDHDLERIEASQQSSSDNSHTGSQPVPVLA